MAYFYRIEDSAGGGPYRGDVATLGWCRKSHNNSASNITPSPFKDFGDDWREIQYDGIGLFGFSTLEQLQSWFFPEEILALQKMGFKIVRVKGEALLQSDRQVYFKPSEDQLWVRTSYPTSVQSSCNSKTSVVNEFVVDVNF